MSKKNTERKLIDRKIYLARLRTLSAQTLEAVVGGDDFLRYDFRNVYISGH